MPRSLIASPGAVLFGGALLLAASGIVSPPALPGMETSCQMFAQGGLGWSCPLTMPATEGGGGELILELEYSQPFRTPVTELWEVIAPSNESWQAPVRGSAFGARGTLALSQRARISSGLWRARALGLSVTPVSVRLRITYSGEGKGSQSQLQRGEG